ncbi:hypothetical protein [Gryllotalpicola protaetiae]|uniref:Hemagglutinin n=1 Tax=Gryllotalpicola protaetiae TaxID=2419771 RepID=A0A387BT87_9MICO|nr:hypothetical protein [Gryllotalpicola protaetiae]AYG04280.1 hypothetical protein D7I44_12590 [Gryllotalpicola protaetiae]
MSVKRVLARTLAGSIAAICVAATLALLPGSPAQALSAADWDPGDIISDATLYDSGSMSTDAVQAFLNAREGGCTAANGYPCLKDYHESTPTTAAASGCGQYGGVASESAASIIAHVGQTCGINPRVLIVMLEKEQGLVTSVAPTSSGYAHAMGYNCPDTAPCSSATAGFFKQVYGAAWQLKYYSAHPNSYQYKIGASYVQYNPNAGCGGTTVQIKNQATADLYIYTPYQPNAAALANLNGVGDSCSAYGNRNFWVDYNAWFGNPGWGTSPVGSLDSAAAGLNRVELSGWAVDPDSQSPIDVHVYLDGQWFAQSIASVSRPDVGASMPWYGANHGFDITVGLPAGTHQYCVYGISGTGHANALIGCRTVTSLPDNPTGNFESLSLGSTSSRTATVTGWAVDGNTSDPIDVHFYVNGRWTAMLTADGNRPDVARAMPGIGAAHGFSGQLTLPTGTDVVCAYGINTGAGTTNPQLGGCRTVVVGTGAPQGNFEGVAYVNGRAQATGWAFDPDQSGPISVKVTVNGVAAATGTADGNRPDVANALPGYGAAHGFSVQAVIPFGTSTVCVIAGNVGAGSDKTLGCRTVSTPSGPPYGNFEGATVANGKATVTGWAIDPDTAGPATIKATVGSQTVGTFTAGSTRADVAAAFPAYGTSHGFSQSLTIPVGTNSLCLTAVNVGPAAADTSLGCKTVSTATGSPQGNLETATVGVDTVAFSGWAVDPDQAAPITVRVTVDGKATQTTADVSRPDVAAVYPGYGAAHGFSATVPTIVGSHQVCVTAVNAGPASADTSLGCKTLVVTSGNPIGNFEKAVVQGASVEVVGWTVDGDQATTPLSVRVYINGADAGGLTASVDRQDVATQLSALNAGPAHGYDGTVPIPAGESSVCVFAMNVGPGTANTLLGCTNVTR